jgi:deoxyribonuclease-1
VNDSLSCVSGVHRIPVRGWFAATLALAAAACAEDQGASKGAAPHDADGGGVDPGLPKDTGIAGVAGCEPWAGMGDGELLSRLHAHLQGTYEPIDPEPDVGGLPNRYTTARHRMFTLVERLPPPGGVEPGVEAVYTGRFVATGPDEEPDDDDINCEHTWPRARMDPDRDGALYSHEESDIHGLYPSDSGVNSARGSLRFGEPVSEIDETYLPALVGLDAAGERVFKPRSVRLGDLARAQFYFATRWGAAIRDDEEAVLRDWAADDPVEARERHRNDSIEAIQGNRNPYVDCPGLAERIVDFADFAILDRDLALP